MLGEAMLKGKLVSGERLVGKTIKAQRFDGLSEEGYLVFTDGTFAAFRVHRGYDPGDEWVGYLEKDQADQIDPGELALLGVLSQDAALAIREERKRKSEERLRQRERATLRRLQQKYKEEPDVNSK